MNDFQKFKEEYESLRTTDESIPPILDFLEMTQEQEDLILYSMIMSHLKTTQ